MQRTLAILLLAVLAVAHANISITSLTSGVQVTGTLPVAATADDAYNVIDYYSIWVPPHAQSINLTFVVTNQDETNEVCYEGMEVFLKYLSPSCAQRADDEFGASIPCTWNAYDDEFDSDGISVILYPGAEDDYVFMINQTLYISLTRENPSYDYATTCAYSVIATVSNCSSTAQIAVQSYTSDDEDDDIDNVICVTPTHVTLPYTGSWSLNTTSPAQYFIVDNIADRTGNFIANISSNTFSCDYVEVSLGSYYVPQYDWFSSDYYDTLDGDSYDTFTVNTPRLGQFYFELYLYDFEDCSGNQQGQISFSSPTVCGAGSSNYDCGSLNGAIVPSASLGTNATISTTLNISSDAGGWYSFVLAPNPGDQLQATIAVSGSCDGSLYYRILGLNSDTDGGYETDDIYYEGTLSIGYDGSTNNVWYIYPEDTYLGIPLNFAIELDDDVNCPVTVQYTVYSDTQAPIGTPGSSGTPGSNAPGAPTASASGVSVSVLLALVACAIALSF